MHLHGTMKINAEGHLEIGGCDTVELAREFGTPLWVMDEEYIRENCARFRRAFMEDIPGDVAYASKAFLTLAMAVIIKEEGLSMDVASGGELYTAAKAEFPMERIYFHGNNKNAEELKLAVDYGVGRIVVDNHYELDLLEEMLKSHQGKPVAVLLRIKPGIEAHTHEYVKTGQEDSKFGFSLGSDALEAASRVVAQDGLMLRGIHCHIGSQIFETESFAATAEIMMDFIASVKEKLGTEIAELNLGGGFGIYYSGQDAPVEAGDYSRVIAATVRTKAAQRGLREPRIAVEPGRAIVGGAGATLYTVGAIKDIPGIRKYVAVDGGMADNIRPALYQAEYEAVLANKAAEEAVEVVSIAGKCCESGDMLAWNIPLGAVEPGDILAVPCTGAYGLTMASNYNRLPRPAVVLVKDGWSEVIVKRETYDDMMRSEVLPERFKKKGKLSAASI